MWTVSLRGRWAIFRSVDGVIPWTMGPCFGSVDGVIPWTMDDGLVLHVIFLSVSIFRYVDGVIPWTMGPCFGSVDGVIPWTMAYSVDDGLMLFLDLWMV